MRKISILIALFVSLYAVPVFAVDGILSPVISSDGSDYIAMYGDYVVWRGNNGTIKLYDMGKTPPSTTEIGQGSRPNIFGNIIVWIDSTLGNNIVKYDISTGSKVQISESGSYLWDRPWIHKNKIVWGGRLSSGGPYYANIQIHDMFTGQTNTLPVQGPVLPYMGTR